MILGIAVLSLLLVLCLGATWTLDRTADQVASLLESAWISETTEEAAAQWPPPRKSGSKTGAYLPPWWTTSGWKMWRKDFLTCKPGCSRGEKSEFIRTCRALAQQVRTMAESEKPYYYNIL